MEKLIDSLKVRFFLNGWDFRWCFHCDKWSPKTIKKGLRFLFIFFLSFILCGNFSLCGNSSGSLKKSRFCPFWLQTMRALRVLPFSPVLGSRFFVFSSVHPRTDEPDRKKKRNNRCKIPTNPLLLVALLLIVTRRSV